MNFEEQASLTKDESLALRGLCISLVVLHNLIHNVVPFQENEKWFNIDYSNYFLSNMSDSPLLAILSYVGWMGVPIFFFLCGYGLRMKYGDSIPSRLSFIKKHYLKLLFLFGPIVVINNLHAHKTIASLLGQLTFLDPVHNMLPAAFWYVVCAFEFYILYAIVLHRIKSKWLLAVGAFLCLSLLFLDDMVVKAIRYHCLGWFLGFALGCYTADQPKYLAYLEKTWAVVIVFVLLAFSTINKQMWVVSDVLMILFLLSVRRFLNMKGLVAIGAVSAFLYAVHPIVRNLWLYLKIDYTNGNGLVIMLTIAAYFIICLLVAYAYRFVYVHVETYIKRKLYGKNES